MTMLSEKSMALHWVLFEKLIFPELRSNQLSLIEQLWQPSTFNQRSDADVPVVSISLPGPIEILATPPLDWIADFAFPKKLLREIWTLLTCVSRVMPNWSPL